MCCLKWRKTYRKALNLSPGEIDYLAQASWIKGQWIVVTILAGDNTLASGAASLWSVPIHGGLVSDDWRIVPPHQDYSDNQLRLEIKVTNDLYQLRLVNKYETKVLTWANVTLLVLSQDDPTIQELQGTGSSTVSLYYLPAEAGGSFDPAELESRLDALEDEVESLQNQISAAIADFNAALDAERHARLAMLAQLQSQIALVAASYWEPVTNGDPVNPEILFADGDVVMAQVTP